MRGYGFWMQRTPNTRSIAIMTWEHLIATMIYDGRLTIWKQLQAGDILMERGALYTHSTPKLRKMMRALPDSRGASIN